MPGLDDAAAEVRAVARRLERPEVALSRAAELCADATRAGIEAQGLVASGELRESVYARGSEWGVGAEHATFVNERRPFVPVAGDELVEPLASRVRELLDAHIRGEG